MSSRPNTSPTPNLPWFAVWLAGTAPFFTAFFYPLLRDGVIALLLLTWGWLLFAWRRGRLDSLRSWGDRIGRSSQLQNGLVVLTTIFLLLGSLEGCAQVSTRLGVAEFDTPMRTMLPEGAHDWRLAHITADRYREPDPVLFWRPVAGKPYTRQRFRGPVLKRSDGDDTFRIFCYGDSNTDGPTRGGSWPARLQERLDTRSAYRFQVLNAGVAGYSSHQGLLRLRQEIERYRHDLILVSFGWNDAADALGVTDRGYRPPSPFMAGFQRLLLRYRFFLVSKFYLRSSSEPPAAVGPRVSQDEYLENLKAFQKLGEDKGVPVVLLTRPHRQKPEVLAQNPIPLLRQVPRYNEALRALAKEASWPFVDVQRHFGELGPDFFVDEAHFSLGGHGRMALFLEEKLSDGGFLEKGR